MGYEEVSGRECEPEGDRFLRLLGIEYLADEPIPGRTERVRDFLDICGDHARPLLLGLESLSPDDPRFESTRDVLKKYVVKFTQPSASERES